MKFTKLFLLLVMLNSIYTEETVFSFSIHANGITEYGFNLDVKFKKESDTICSFAITNTHYGQVNQFEKTEPSAFNDEHDYSLRFYNYEKPVICSSDSNQELAKLEHMFNTFKKVKDSHIYANQKIHCKLKSGLCLLAGFYFELTSDDELCNGAKLKEEVDAFEKEQEKRKALKKRKRDDEAFPWIGSIINKK
jgi:hypothetical protein